MAAILPPITGVQFKGLQHAITALRAALRHHRGVSNLRPIQLRVDFHRDIDRLGDQLVLSPAAMILFRSMEAVQNDITPRRDSPAASTRQTTNSGLGPSDGPRRIYRLWHCPRHPTRCRSQASTSTSSSNVGAD